MLLPPPSSTLFPYTTLFRSSRSRPSSDFSSARYFFSDSSRANTRSSPRRFGIVVRLRSEEHTSELQSRENLVCRLLLEKKKHSLARLIALAQTGRIADGLLV